MSCEHKNFRANVEINRFEENGTFTCDVSVACHECGLPFSFTGLPLAISTSRACLNVDGTVLTLPIEPGPKPIPISGIIPIDFPVRRES